MSEDLLNQLLLARGIETPEAREKFLQPQYERDINSPFLMKGMKEATERVWRAIREGEKVVVFADYDADGVPGAAVLTEFFRKVNFTNFEVYIPNRHTEDYGLMASSVRDFAQQGAKLLITIDCGISNVEEIKLANELGLEVIVTDHHLPPEVLPPAYAIVNPKQPGDSYPDPMLCGAGVAFKLVQALVRSQSDLGNEERKRMIQWEKTLLDLVAIATIGDRVPLKDENRALTAFGLMILQRTPRLGLNVLFSLCRLKRGSINEDDVGFMLGPRINSAGRMSHASEAYLLLTTRDPMEAQAIAEKLERQNSERKALVEEITRGVESQFTIDSLPAVLVVGAETWSPGVLGLAASRLVEKFARPVFVWGGGEEGMRKGSCRSDGSINVVELMKLAGGDEFFAAMGGHTMAGGFSIAAEQVGNLSEKLLRAHTQASHLDKPAESRPDANISIDDVSDRAWGMVEQLAPFGVANPKPLFRFPNLEIYRAKTFGNGGVHLELSFKQSNGRQVCAVGFFTGKDKFKSATLEAGHKINLIATLEKSYFKASPELRLRIVDIVAS
jgi:single-stranded-DNA-specific exonuclease